MTAAARKGRRADPAKDEAILAAAQTLFAERGYGVSIDEIAAAAGVAKQTIYARYDGKHDLLAAVVLKTAEALVRPLAIGAAKPEAALTEFGVRFVDVVFAPGKLAMQRLIISEAATFPVAARAVVNWFPFRECTFANAVVIAGSTLGMIFNGPLVAALMEAYGWRATFFATSAAGFLVAFLWWRYATNRPEEHPRIGDAEVRAIAAGRPKAAADGRRDESVWRMLLRNRNLRLISVSYFLDSFVLFIFVFWFYLYLTDERGFGVLKGGVYNSLPYVFASVMLPLLGRLCDAAAVRIGRGRSRRAFAIASLLSAALFLFLGANVSAPLPAILCLSLAVGFLVSTEGPFWSTTTETAGAHGGTAGGVMNTAGNLAGVASTALAPVLVGKIGWVGMFAVCAAMLVAAGLIWLVVQVEPPAPDASLPS